MARRPEHNLGTLRKASRRMRGAVMRSEIRFDLDNSADPLHSAGFVNQKLSKGFGELIGYMMAKDRYNRYRTPSDLVVDLKSVMQRGAPFVARETVPKPIKT